MRAILNLPPSVRLIEAGLEGLVQVNRVLIETGVVPPSPADTSVRYKRERSGLEEWDNALTCIRRGWGDCEDLNSWECARINLTEDEWAVCNLIQTGAKMFHCIILMSDGSRRDICPSLGMRVPGTSLEGIPWVETRAENYIGATRRQTIRALRRGGVIPTIRHGGTGKAYRPKPSSQTQSSTPYQPKSSRSDPASTTKETTPGSEAETMQMVSPQSAQNPAMGPMPMMDDEADPAEGLDEPELDEDEDEDEGL